MVNPVAASRCTALAPRARPAISEPMKSAFSLFKASAPKPPSKPAIDPKDLPEGMDPSEAEGLDQRRLAELKAEAVGERWRKAAEAEGKIPKEEGGPKGLEPTRYGDWEKAGRCFDF
jgi:hypothetical protein